MSYSIPVNELGQVLVNFSENGTYPEEEATSAAKVEDSVLPAALAILKSARQDLESEIRTVSQESAPDVDGWIVHAKGIQDDIQESKKLANNIARKAQEEDQRREALEEQEVYAKFLQKELSFQDQLLASMNAIQHVHQLLNEAEDLACRFKIPHALLKLDNAEEALKLVRMAADTRTIHILKVNHMELQQLIRGQFTTAWNGLVEVNPDEGTITIHQNRDGTIMDMATAIQGIQRFNDVDEVARKLCNDLEVIFIGPRTDIKNQSPRSIQTDQQSISIGDVTDSSLKSLFVDLGAIVRLLNATLPSEITSRVATIMMPLLSQRLLDTWLYSAVPPSLDRMEDYQKALAVAQTFGNILDESNWPGSSVFHDWVAHAPRIWLNKRRETGLDWTRNQISLGIGTPYEVERVEKQMVDKAEAKELGGKASGNVVNQEWDSAWGSDDGSEVLPQNGERHCRSLEEERQASAIVVSEELLAAEDEEDAADAWGWNDEDDASAPVSQPTATNKPTPLTSEVLATREVTLSEKYYISTMPQPIFNVVKRLYDDGARLTQPETEESPISAAAPGLFSLPTLVLAMYRAVSPSAYASRPGGNMYLYNDGMWLSESFTKFITEWNERTDLTLRTFGMVKLEPEIKALISFGKRAYTNELTEQRLLINDLFGGTQNFFQQDVAPGKHSLDESINTVIRHIREQSEIWKAILPYSAWASAVGSLVNTVATRIITDVFDLSDISVDDAERIATVISRVESMDDMFMKSTMPGHIANKSSTAEIPMTSRFADQWLKMVFLSEFLQSNLEQVKYLWLESDFSLYFGVDEVLELIGLSFEKNAAVRAAMREIRNSPNPRVD